MKTLCFLLFVLSNKLLSGEIITAVMITGKDRFHHALATLSIRSFLEQTYPDKHLLIINDGEQQFTFSPGGPITEIKVNRGLTLGDLRNIALENIPENALWVQWDDDDWHHPKVMEEQYKFLTHRRVDLCCMMSQVQYDFRSDAAWTIQRMIQGTVMCRKKKDIFYPPLTKGEDSDFFIRYCRKYKSVGWNNPSHYYLRFIQGHNTWGEELFMTEKKVAREWNISTQAKEYLSQILLLYPKSTALFWFQESNKASNFGDALSPLIVEKIMGRKMQTSPSSRDGRLLAIGSILHFAKDADVIWGAGINGKIMKLSTHLLDVRAVRGPLTRQFLLDHNIPCPPIYGDPALLMPRLFPELKADPTEEFIVIPNKNEIDAYQDLPHLVLPTEDCMEVVRRILKAKFVISGSLHGIIVAEAFGIPAIHLRLTQVEPLFKYQDYYLGTGRKTFKIAHTLEEALLLGGEPPHECDLDLLLDQFPYDKFL